MFGKELFFAVLCSLHFFTFGHMHNPRDALKVRFEVFKDVPRTEAEAVKNGFSLVSDCNTGNFRGKQYMKDDDPQVIPLYDANGYIAGLQAGVPTGLENFPPPNMQPPFIADGEYYKLTAYFVHPSTICTGRTELEFNSTGTGEKLFFQTGPDPETDLLQITEYQEQTNWVKGLCFPKMGYHYFKEVAKDMSCADFFPIALLYYKGQLEGFVWSFGTILNSTYVRYEYPEPEFFLELLADPPTCLLSLYRSTLHVYFRDNIDTFTCDDETSGASDLQKPVWERLAIFSVSVLILLRFVWF